MALDRDNEKTTLRQRFEIVPGQYRPKVKRNGALFIAFCLIFVWIIYTKPSIPFLSGGGTKVTTEFEYGANIRPGYTPIRVGGVDVGQVTSIERAPSGRGVRVKFVIENKSVKLHEDASINLQWRTLLGRNMFLNVDVGSPSAPLMGDNKFIPRSRTSDQVELDTALEPLGDGGRKGLQTILGEFDEGFKNPDAVHDFFKNAGPTMKPLGNTLTAFRGTEPGRDLPTLVAGTAKTLGALSSNEAALGGLIDNGNVTLAATAARRADLASIVNEAPVALRDTRETMSRLETTLDILDPLAEKLIPGANELSPAIVQTRKALNAAVPLLRDLRPTFDDLSPAVSDLGTLAEAGVPAFGPLTRIINRTRDTFIPFLNEENVSNHRPNYQNVGPAIGAVSAASAFGDANGPVANFEAAAGENAVVTSPCETHVTDLKNPNGLIQCEGFTKLIAGLLTGVQPSLLNLKGVADEGAVNKLLRNGLLKPRPDQEPLRLKKRFRNEYR